MAGVFSVEGKLGTGKTKFAVWRGQQALLEGRRVASNVDLFCEHLTPYRRSTVTRIPDKPTAADLDAIGKGSEGKYDEDRFGVLILDELGTWLNSRSFQDKDRASVLDWLIHARKHRWEVYLIVQDANMIDRQVREALIEYQCRCLRMDKVRIPFLGKFIGAIGEAFGAKRWGYLPKFHLVTARVGYGIGAVVAERWTYVGAELHAAYNTEQAFSPTYPHGVHSVLLPWDWSPRPTLYARAQAFLRARFPFLVSGSSPRRRPPRAALKPKAPIVESILRTLSPDERIRHINRLSARGLL